jgi:hypothetical protein
MSKIFNVRLPNASPEYNAQQFDQLVRSLEQIVLQLNNTYTSIPDQNQAAAASWFGGSGGSAGGGFAGPVRGFQASTGILLPHALLMSNQDQATAGTTSENLVSYNVPVFTYGIRVENNTEIYFDYPGQYLVTISLQVTNTNNQIKEFELWAKNSGTNYPLSNTRFDVPANKGMASAGHLVANVAGIFTVNDATTEYLEIAWWSDGANVKLEHYAAGTSPTRPEIPSVIVTVNFASAEMY